MNLINFCIIFMFISGLIVFSSGHKHLLVALFSLEYLVVTLFLMLFLFLLNYGFEFYFILVYLTFSVCEGALGLGVLVNMIRSHGNDYLSSMSVLSW
uniref:NADH-ubiquinone oxidoreductase chain 4L n=1 Tax=Cloresmus pulchellus TaxID=2575654 RepID=A0A4D6X1S9_9HEMI|nr:NADH dehydrogenase subunit 4L [Cloresmus pulchellus]QCI09322.1 NADH dehydrogenase subunit 4L [Cloresmus pulchellus]